MIDGVGERPADSGMAVCTAQVGPIWKLGGEVCGCMLPADHLGDHECSCGSIWVGGGAHSQGLR